MESCSQLYTRKIADSIIHGLEQRHSSILFVKHYNTLNVPIDDIQDAVSKSTKRIELMYHEFSANRMQEAYEPFLGWIKQLYLQFYSNVPLDEFLEKGGVYYLSRPTIKSYIEKGECKRTEDIIVVEIEYERKQFAHSLSSLFSYISQEHTLLFVLNRLHLAENSTLNFLQEFIQKSYDNVSLLANYNEAYTTPPYTLEQWRSLVYKVEELNYMFDWNMQDPQADVNIIESFEPVLADLPEYLVHINNMIHTLATKQAMYYLKIVYNKIITDKLNISAKNQAKFYILYAMAALYDLNVNTTLIMCDKLKSVNNKHPDIRYTFRYHYLLTLCEIYGGQPSLALKNAEKCKKIAVKSGSERYAFTAQMLEFFCILDGCNNFYRWDTNIDEDELKIFSERALKYKSYNHLAHVLFFGIGNKRENFVGGTLKLENQESFRQAMQIAQMLKNDRLIIAAWRKNVFMAQGYGCYSYVDDYYKKCLEIITKQNDQGEEAAIYNGLGFNRIVSEQFGIANDYFNRALEKFYKLKDSYYVAETLYNMATNAILADNYETAYNYLLHCLKLLKSIKQHRMKICNMAKVYGMVVYCSYKMGIEYNAHFYLNKMERSLYHIIYPDGEPNYFLWDDDMFFYYFTSGLLEKSNNLQKAQEYFDKAQYHMFCSEGLLFFAYAMFAEEQSDLYEAQGRYEEAKNVLNKCIEFCNKKGYKHKEEVLFAKLHKRSLIHKTIPLPLTSVDKYHIDELAQIAEMEMMLADKTKGIDFLVAWQELLNKENSTINDIIENSMVTLQNNYNIDCVIYVEMVDKKPVIRFNGGDLTITQKQLDSIAAYLTRHKKEFVASRFEREFYEYTPITLLFGINNIVSFACVPLASGDSLTGFMLAYIEMHDNMTGNIIFLDRNDLTIFKFALRQMTDTLYRIKTRDEINQMNMKLRRSAVTDLLTGLLNRQGFSKKIDDYAELVEKGKKENVCVTLLYIDLDNFKYCNDTFGHDVGDAILIEFSRLFERVTQHKGYIVRYGGDEFLIVMPEHNVEEGITVAKEIYKEIEQCQYFIPVIRQKVHTDVEIPENHRVSCSIGISSVEGYNQDTMNIALKHADTKLYDVKKNQKSNYSVWREE